MNENFNANLFAVKENCTGIVVTRTNFRKTVNIVDCCLIVIVVRTEEWLDFEMFLSMLVYDFF